MEKEVALQAPWILCFRRLKQLFQYDSDVQVERGNNDEEIKLYVKGTHKAEALNQLLWKEKQFGNITVKITIIPDNEDVEATYTELFEDAFKGNPVFRFGKHVSGQLGTFDFIVFTAIPAQYYSDNLFDYKGCTTELFEDMAKDIFDVGDDAVRFCSDVPPFPDGTYTTNPY